MFPGFWEKQTQVPRLRLQCMKEMSIFSLFVLFTQLTKTLKHEENFALLFLFLPFFSILGPTVTMQLSWKFPPEHSDTERLCVWFQYTCKILKSYQIQAMTYYMKSLLEINVRLSFTDLLRALHSASCDPSSNVSAVKKVDDVIRERPQLEASITYGLKADMIRLVGNLMYRNKGNQDFVSIGWICNFFCPHDLLVPTWNFFL